jgi:hypothetical protein
MLRYFRGLFQGLGRVGTARRPSPSRRYRPRLEALEDRLAPALLWTVTDGGDSVFDPQSLRFAMLLAQPGDTIDFAPAVRKISLGSGLEVRTNVSIVNDQGTGPVTIDGGGAVTPFTVDAGVTASLSGLTIAHGNVALSILAPFGDGGGILNQGTLTLTDCTLSGNSAWDGGGIFNQGTLTLTRCTLSGNSAEEGGGIDNRGSLTLDNCVLSHNTGGDGGGIENDGVLALSNCTVSGNSTGYDGEGGGINNTVGTLTLTGCTLSRNSARQGGGVANQATLTLTNCTLAGNSAREGGGIDNFATLTLTNCTLAGNSAGDEGGGGIGNQGMMTLTNCTLAGNTASCDGGGIDNQGMMTLTSCTLAGNDAGPPYFQPDGGGGIDNRGGTALLHNSIVAGNFNDLPGHPADDILGTVGPSSSYNLIGTGGSGGLSNGVNGNLVGNLAGLSNPGLAPLADNGGPTQTRALMPTSRALGAGDPALFGTIDQRGVIRTGAVNIGAYQDRLRVQPVPLIAPNRTYRVVSNTALTTTPVNGLLANFVDPDGLAPSALPGSVHTAHGALLSLNADGTFSYAPNAGFRGTDTFTYQITDGVATSAEATVTLIVGQPPVAADLSFFVNSGSTLIVGVANGLVGANGDTGGVAHFAGWVPGSPLLARGLTLNADGSFTFVAPSGTPNEVATFQYYVTNPDGTSSIGLVDITIHGQGILPPPGKFPPQPPSPPRPL